MLTALERTVPIIVEHNEKVEMVKGVSRDAMLTAMLNVMLTKNPCIK